MKILIISGFLGAGKTTFIKEMVKATKREYVIFENEFADVNIDSKILKEDNSEINVWEFTEGCICCNMKGDFTSSLIVIQNTLNPDFIIIEPSGVGVLSSIMAAISKIEYENISLLEPITIVDANTVDKYISKYSDIYIDQIKSAKFIQLSKTEQMSEGEKEEIKSKLQSLNEEAIIFTEHYKNRDEIYWNELFSGELNKKVYDGTNISGDMEHVSYKRASCPNLTELMKFLNRVLLGFFGDICRGKGVFLVDDTKLRFDIVDGIYNITLAQDEDENDVVFIGNGIKSINLKSDLLKLSLKSNSINLT